MNKYIKISYVLLIIIILFSLNTQVYAKICDACGGTGYPKGAPAGSGEKCPVCKGTGRTSDAGDIVSDADGFISKGEKQDSPITTEGMMNLSNTLYNTLFIFGVIAAFIVGGLLGIKYITGGIEGQVDVKNTMIAYIAGCVVLFGAFAIWKIVIVVLQ